jgi:1,4-dihydroxy-2-naphthoate octaprenyltransferase
MMVVSMFFHRVFRPAALTLALAALFLGFTWSFQDRIYGAFDNIVAGVAIGISVVLFLAWYYDSDRARRAGFLLSVWLWVTTSAVAFMNIDGWTSGLISFTLAVLAGGSYWAEVSDERTR